MSLDATQRRALLSHPAGWFATGFGAGLAPVAPGTVGSLVALVPYLAMRELSWPFYFSIVALVFALGVVASRVVVARLRTEDPGVVVVDEFVGLWLALAAAPHDWRWVVAGFVLFRLFDIWKPWPVSWADRNIGGGLGVMLDDALAGVMAGAVLAALVHFI
jgi:phosphatidylglycerophosphatase A